MKKLMLASVLFLMSYPMYGTAIVIYITPSFVIMAADSKGVAINVRTGKETTSIVSKIYKSGNVYFALSGVINNNLRNFDVARIVDMQFKKYSNPDSAIIASKKAVSNALVQYLTYTRKNNNKLYKANLAAAAYITSIGIITIHNNRPYAHIIGFKVADATTITINVEEDFFAPEAKRDAVYYLGQTNAINAYMSNVKSVESSPDSFVNKLMRLQIKSTPQKVNLPIDMIRLTNKSATWISRKKRNPGNDELTTPHVLLGKFCYCFTSI